MEFLERNKHHLWWERADYKKQHEHHFRNFGAFVVPLEVNIHKELHARIEAPQKPHRYQMGQVLDYVRNTPQAHRVGEFWAIERTIGYFIHQAIELEPAQAVRCLEIKQNLQDQLAILKAERTIYGGL